jgi:membrane associated rhomboid family serine protease
MRPHFWPHDPYVPRWRRGYPHEYDRGYGYPYWYLPQAVSLLLSLFAQARALPAQPPVTLTLAGFLCALHFRELLLAAPLARALPQHALVGAACLQPATLLHGRQLWRLALSPLLHLDDLHIYYNCASFLLKGAALEPRLGSRRFAELLLRLALTGGALHCALAAALAFLSPAAFGHQARDDARARSARACCVRVRACVLRACLRCLNPRALCASL